jgi:osmotically-inducible protein OsmY
MMRRRAGWAALAAVPMVAGCALLGRGATESPEAAMLRVAEESRIRIEVEARLALEPAIDAARVRVVVAARDVHLHGSVDGFGALRCALATAGMVRDVLLVVDYLVMNPGPNEVTCLSPRVVAGT